MSNSRGLSTDSFRVDPLKQLLKFAQLLHQSNADLFPIQNKFFEKLFSNFEGITGNEQYVF